MQLYQHPYSPNSRRALIVIEHLGLACERKFVDLAQGAQQAPEYLLLNPMALVPTLVDEDFVLTESRAIMQYLARKAPEAGLFPDDFRTQLQITKWQFWDASHYGPQIGTLFLERFLKARMNSGAPDENAVSAALDRFKRFSRVLNQELERRDFLVGSALTLADLSVGCSLTYAPQVGVDLAAYPGIARWHARLQELEAWKKTLPQLE
jgi:glutathione S-transferase